MNLQIRMSIALVVWTGCLSMAQGISNRNIETLALHAAAPKILHWSVQRPAVTAASAAARLQDYKAPSIASPLHACGEYSEAVPCSVHKQTTQVRDTRQHRRVHRYPKQEIQVRLAFTRPQAARGTTSRQRGRVPCSGPRPTCLGIARFTSKPRWLRDLPISVQPADAART